MEHSHTRLHSRRAQHRAHRAPARLALLTVFLALPVACDRAPEPPRSNELSLSTTQASRTASIPPSTYPSIDGDIGASCAARRLTPLSEFRGAIRHIVVQTPGEFVEPMMTPIIDLLRNLPVDARITFACSDDRAVALLRSRLNAAGQALRAGLSIRPVHRPMLIWSRDRYIAMSADSQGVGLPPIWLVPELVRSFDTTRRAAEREIPNLLNGFAPVCRIATSSLALEGGNVLFTGRHVLIGRNVLGENAATFTSEEVTSELSRTFTPRVLLVADHTGRPPINHVDMFVSVVGDGALIVGSPRLAAEIMRSADADSMKALEERLFVTPDMPEPKGPDFTEARSARFDEVASALSTAGYQVYRMPYVDSRSGDFVVSYNNMLQETRKGRHHVFMPTYRIPALDDAAARTLESLGMEVHRVDVTTVCRLLGAIRCMANVVERD